MNIPNPLAAAIGQRWFRRIVRNPLPELVFDISARIFPVPVLCSERDLVVRFRFQPPFERDVQFWGWQEWKKGMFIERTIYGAG